MPTLIVYGIMALAIMAAAAGAYQLVDNNWATDAGIARGRQEATAELQPKLAACTDALATQERAVQVLKAEGDARIARATKGLAEATRAASSAKTEAQRLRGLASRPAELKECPAGAAVSEIRLGLTKQGGQ